VIAFFSHGGRARREAHATLKDPGRKRPEAQAWQSVR
jgi:hypothetical protein